jgi:hypothetical protein
MTWWLNILMMLSKVRDGFGGYHASPPFCMEGLPLRLLSVGPWFQQSWNPRGCELRSGWV